MPFLYGRHINNEYTMQLFKRLILAMLTIVSFTSCTKTEKPLFDQRDYISLAGTWQCDLGEIELPGTVDESRLAPLTEDTLRTTQLTRLNPYMGKMKYTREINIPTSLEGKEWRLIMERTKPSVVWIDGDSIGANSLILSPQIYTIGNLSAGNHTITIEVNNDVNSVPQGIQGSHAWTDATQTNWNGVIGRFGLEANDGLLIEELQVYPSTASRDIPVTARIHSLVSGKAKVVVKGYTWNTNKEISLPEQDVELDINEGTGEYKFTIDAGEEVALWSEFDPALYKVNFQVECQNLVDNYNLDFGIRDFSTNGTQFTINSLKTFMRGKHDACVFPLTGYPPMEKEEWVRQFRISKQYGINHYRFHSWTPPQAAFDAANEEGIYMQAELPYWGTMSRENTELNAFLSNEGEHILSAYGNNASFVMMALGNELGGDTGLMREIVEGFRSSDDRRLYAFGANNALGTGGQQEGEDFFVTCRVGGQVGSDDYSLHSRSTFSFADAKNGGYMNGLYPSTDKTFSKAVGNSTVPVISHENGQFQVYPDYDEIKKYTGVLYPYNMEVFRRRLAENNLLHQAKDFHNATARFAAICYKEDFEMCLRTPGFGGFQVLDLQDYPGQGSAYVGLLDAFMDSKGGIAPEEFKGFCDEVVPMAVMPKYCWYNNEAFIADILLSNFSADDLHNLDLQWTISKATDHTIVSEGRMPMNVKQGELKKIGSIKLPLQQIERSTQLQLALKVGSKTNRYDLWVYTNNELSKPASIEETTSLESALQLLGQGKTVLYIPDHKEVEELTVGGLFTPDYWNYAMFKSISESLKRDVSPGTLSILTDPSHPVFNDFPTEYHSNWQWWIISRNSRPFILDRTPEAYSPIIQVVDNIERNHKLGILFEMQVGSGKLLVSMCDLEKIKDKPEGKQFYQSILNYASSSDFMPKASFSPSELRELFKQTVDERDIIGVRNITTYQ